MLPDYVEGGPHSPLGARALYLGSSLYRIHGSNEPWTIGTHVSSGCIRLTNEDVSDLFDRVSVGAKVVVLPKHAPVMARGGNVERTNAVRMLASSSMSTLVRDIHQSYTTGDDVAQRRAARYGCMSMPG